MTYQETINYLFTSAPLFQNVGGDAYKEGLSNTHQLDTYFGHPHQQYKTIHVAGTNGKGSCSHTLAAVLQASGLKVGLFTSPHLVDFRERIRVNGEMVSEQYVIDFVEQHRSFFEPLHPSFFELTTAMAFRYFAEQRVDVAVVEVGLGGRLDCTNIITPEVCVITNISFDHVAFLGDTLAKIAGEKAGIIKDGVPVVIGETQLETAPVFVKTAANHHAPITFADQHYVVDDISRYTEELTGEYQKKNIATVLEAVEVLRKTTDFELQPEAVRKGLAKVVTNTHLHGRWQKIGENPLTICETAHNAPGIDSMLGKLATMDYDNLHVVYGCVNDKDYRKILNHLNTEFSRLGKPFRWYFSQPSVPRGLPVADLLAAASEQGIEGKGYEKVKDAIAEARSTACKDDFVLVTGSIFLIADALA